MSELLPLHLSSAVKITARSSTKVTHAWKGGKPSHPGGAKDSDACDRGPFVSDSEAVLVVSVTS